MSYNSPPSIETEKVTTKVAPVIAVLVVSALVMILNETVLTVALPALMTDFSVTASVAQWLTTGFLLTMAVVIPMTGFLIQRFTTRELFFAAVSIFTVGTLLAAIAPSFGVMLLARVAQACGTAVILPLLMTTTLTSVPVAYRGMVMGLNSVVISVAPAIGPTLSGLVVDSMGWRWIFGLMVPVVVVALVLGAFMIRTNNDRLPAEFDVTSVIISVFAFGGIVYGLSTASSVVAGSVIPIVALVVGAAALALFVARQIRLQRTDAALLDLRPFRVRNFTVSVIVVMVAMATMLGTVIVLPIYLQAGLGVTVMVTGLALLPGGLVQGILSPIVGRLYDKLGPLPVVVPGALLLAGGQWSLATINSDSDLRFVIAMHVMFCVGMALLMTPLMTVSLGSLPRHQYAHGSAIMNTMQQLAGAAGTAVFIAVMSLGSAGAQAGGRSSAVATGIGTGQAFTVGGVVALLAVVGVFFVRRLPTVAHDVPAPDDLIMEREAGLVS
ncbi:multidrug efflux MFS transporter [Tessaracoccus sp. OS52]|uniref:MDR family MFS transporter n=1 Tax=Tessaracoccus sp. OS52 TaxID=2886691 RepID=UPI001D0FB20D|nr:MDR family MFS transporter [Tessaracoccus sp. OS52]MCC2593581.1 multidrug efflux MFS transporter [Tessaracoccus sp. OS52]